MDTRQIGPLFGHQLDRGFHRENAPAVLFGSGSALPFALTHFVVGGATAAQSRQVTAERAFTISVHLFAPDTRGWGTWMDGQFREINQWPAGGIGIYDLEASPVAVWPSAFEAVHIHLPRRTLDNFAKANDQPAGAALKFVQGEKDVFLHHWARLMLSYVTAQKTPSEQAQEHYAHILCAHLLKSYGISHAAPPTRHKGGLAPWQKRIVQALINDDAARRLQVSTLAARCGLSVSHFSRAFRQSFDMPAHRYLLQQRVDLAKHLIVDAEKTLAEIALDAGFADQSTFCRTFSAIVGTSPGRWRREAVLKSTSTPDPRWVAPLG